MLTALLRDHARPYRAAIALVAVLQLAQALAALSLPTLNARLIDDGVSRGDAGAVLDAGAVMLAVVVFQLGCAAGAGYAAARVAAFVGRDLRARVFERTLGFSAREMARFGAATLLTRTTNDVQQVQTLLYLALTGLAVPVMMFAGGIVTAVGLEPRLSGLIPAVLLALLAVLGVILYRLRGPFAAMQDRLDQVNRVLREQIGGVRVIRAFVREEHERARFAEANTGLAAVSVRAARLMATMFPAGMLVGNLGAVAAVWSGGHLVGAGTGTAGTLIAFLNYLALIMGSALLATFTVLAAPRAQVSARRIGEVLATRTARALPAPPVTTPPARALLTVRDVVYTHPGAQQPVLNGVSLIARPGETTAIIGSTGTGKTTLLNLIARLADPDGGTVLVDGVPVRDLDPAALVRTVGLAPQRAYLFSGTLAANLRYGRPQASDAEVWHALEVAQARGFVEALPHGLDTPVSQGGGNFSGGQRQRLAIARLLVARPLVYLFDDSFSALDQPTERALLTALAAETAGAAVVIVAHRVATVRHAHRIVVLEAGREAGKVAATGTHEELMAASATYREIVSSQYSEEEAA
ncbi:multidrug ABC transporter ATP-binding protein [Microtetraspora sp. NBRC 13810]|nr:multidrug ABC transporter ATP-binding protein [Microtetraspora sp. NBRC 13810]